MAIDETDKLFDLLNEWRSDKLTATSNVGDSAIYINQLYEAVPLLAGQSILFSTTVLTDKSSWDTLQPNTVHYFSSFGNEGSPTTLVDNQAGYLFYIKSSVSTKGLQLCITNDLHILYRVAPQGTWIENASDKQVSDLSNKITEFSKEIAESGISALTLRVQSLANTIKNMGGTVTDPDKPTDGDSGISKEQLAELDKIISQKLEIYDAKQLVTDILNNNPMSIYTNGTQLLTPTINAEGNDREIDFAIGSNNVSNIAKYQVDISTDNKHWTINSFPTNKGTIPSLVNGTLYYVRAILVSDNANIRTDSNYSDIIKVSVGTNLTAKTPEVPTPTQHTRDSKVIRPSDTFALVSDLNKAVSTLEKEKATTGYVDSGLSDLQVKINALKDNQSSSNTGTTVSFVGGRNLLADTKFFHNQDQSLIDSTDYLKNKVLKNSYISGANNKYKDTYSGQSTIPLNEDSYTLTFYAKADTSGNRIDNFFYNTSNNTTIQATTNQGVVTKAVDGKSTISLGTNWARYWIKWTQNAENGIKYLAIGRVEDSFKNVGSIYISKPMLVEGDIPTDWNLAPEDEVLDYDTKNWQKQKITQDGTYSYAICPRGTDFGTFLKSDSVPVGFSIIRDENKQYNWKVIKESSSWVYALTTSGSGQLIHYEVSNGTASGYKIYQDDFDKRYVLLSNITSMLAPYAKTTDLNNYIKGSALGTYAKLSDLDSYVKTSELTGKLNDFALEAELKNYAKASDLDNYMKKDDSSSGYLKFWSGTDSDFSAITKPDSKTEYTILDSAGNVKNIYIGGTQLYGGEYPVGTVLYEANPTWTGSSVSNAADINTGLPPNRTVFYFDRIKNGIWVYMLDSLFIRSLSSSQGTYYGSISQTVRRLPNIYSNIVNSPTTTNGVIDAIYVPKSFLVYPPYDSDLGLMHAAGNTNDMSSTEQVFGTPLSRIPVTKGQKIYNIVGSYGGIGSAYTASYTDNGYISVYANSYKSSASNGYEQFEMNLSSDYNITVAGNTGFEYNGFGLITKIVTD